MNTDSIMSYFFLGAMAFGGIAIIYYGFRVKAKAALIEATPTSQVRNVTTGLVELHGVAKNHGDMLTSPFENVPCVYYRYKVQERRRSGKSSHWATMVEGQSPVPFCLKDETGEITVNPKEAEVHLSTDHTYRTGILGEGDQIKFQQGLEALGISDQGLFGFKRSLRCEETYIRDSEPIYVLGEAQHGDASGITGSHKSQAVISKGYKKIFLISDKSEKGLITALKRRFYVCIFAGVCLFMLTVFLSSKLVI